MNERFERFISSGTELVGVLSLPRSEPVGAVLIVHPFGEEKKFAHRVLTSTAWALSEAGLAVLRFDLAGCGDSFGAFREVGLARWSDDIVTAADLLRRESGCEGLSLFGLRLGATLCWLTHPQLARVDSVVLWEPILSGRHYLETLWRRKLIKEMMTAGRGKTSLEAAREEAEQTGFIDLDGWDLGARMMDDLVALDIGTPGPTCPKRTLAVQIVFNGKVSRPLDAFADAVRKTGADIKVTGIRERPIWDRIDIVPATELIATTTDWLACADAVR